MRPLTVAFSRDPVLLLCARVELFAGRAYRPYGIFLNSVDSSLDVERNNEARVDVDDLFYRAFRFFDRASRRF